MGDIKVRGMTGELATLDRGTIAEAIKDALVHLGLEDTFTTYTGVTARIAEGDQVNIDIRMKCRTPPHRVEIIDDALVVIDRNGNGRDLADLTTRTAAQRQLRTWQAEYTFDHDDVRNAVVEFFAAR